MNRLKRLQQLYRRGLPRPGIPAMADKRAQILAEIGIGKRYYLLATLKTIAMFGAMVLTEMLLVHRFDPGYINHKNDEDPVVVILVLLAAMAALVAVNYLGSYVCARVTMKWQEAAPTNIPSAQERPSSDPGPIDPT